MALTIQVADIERIEILSYWGGGSRELPNAKLVLVRHGACFRREWLPMHQVDELEIERIGDLVTGLARPLVPVLDPSLFELPKGFIAWHYAATWTDDFARHLAKLTLSSGQVVTICTGEDSVQQAFMLPLIIRDSATTVADKTFDPRISRALAALMPTGYLERARLAGELSWLTFHLRIYDPEGHFLQSETLAAELADYLAENKKQDVAEPTPPPEFRAADPRRELSEQLLQPISLDQMRKLLKEGASPKVTTAWGTTALMEAASAERFDNFQLLVEAGADLEARCDGCTGLHRACARGRWEAARAWVQAGADIHARTTEGATPLVLATRHQIVRLLLKKGADVNAVDADGNTALINLMRAWQQRHTYFAEVWPTLRTLLEAGADVTCRDRHGMTAIDHARRALELERLRDEVSKEFCRADYGGSDHHESIVNLLESNGRESATMTS